MTIQKLKALITDVKEKLVAIASDESLDRHGERIAIKGWELGAYVKNPVLQWAHDYSLPPIGKAVNIRMDGQKLIFEPDFHGETELSKQVKTLFEKGYLKAFSVGFIPKEMDGNTITKAELLEISAVPVPSNPNALVYARSIGMDNNFIDQMQKSIEGDEKGAVGDQVDKVDTRRAKWEKLDSVGKILDAFWTVYMDDKTSVDAFASMLSETIGLLAGLTGGAEPTQNQVADMVEKAVDRHWATFINNAKGRMPELKTSPADIKAAEAERVKKVMHQALQKMARVTAHALSQANKEK
mgnify:CR=1 FL=1